MRLSDPRTPIDLKQQGSQIMVDFTGTDLPKNAERRYDTLDFGTPVTGFDAERVERRYPHRARRERRLRPARLPVGQPVRGRGIAARARRPPQSAAPRSKKEYKGERLTLNFQDIETRAVLQLLADASGQNIVVSDTVNGSVTLRLQNVPWDQALDIVLRTKGLGQAPGRQRDHRGAGRRAGVAREGGSGGARRTSRSSSRCAPSTCRSTTPRRPISRHC